jgi:dipeptidyl-peptidase-4
VDYRYKYPKAGEKNSIVQIWIYDLPSGRKVQAETGRETDHYIPRIKWTADPHTLSIRTLNRLQNHRSLLHANAGAGASKVVVDEKTDTYFDIEVLDDLIYLTDGKHFIYTSEAEGYKHLYLYSILGKKLRKLTDGEYEVTDFIGYDEKLRTCYYTSTEESPLERHFYSVSYDGRKKVRLSSEPGKHEINMSPDFQFYIDHYSSAHHPTIVKLYRARKNSLVKVWNRTRNW